MTELANVNGKITPADSAVIPVMDHGFLYGDGVYETIRTYDGRPSLVARHLRRLSASCGMIRVPPLPSADVEKELDRTLDEAANPESYIRVMVTRGVGSIGYESSLGLRPALIIIVLPLKMIPEESYRNGVPVVMGERRRNPVDSLDPAIKSCNLLNNLLAHLEAQDANASETLLLNTQGYLAEGSHTNVFFVTGGVLKTPSLDCGILSGITREVVMEMARREKIPCREGTYRREEVESAEEIFVTSTLQELMPATRLDGRPIGEGVPGPVTRLLLERYRRFVRGEGREEPVP
jgi:branched-chain amino acid aminotransferase